MTDRRYSYWHEGDDEAVIRYRAEHASVGSFDGVDTFTVESGNEALLPEWPPVVNLPGLAVPLSPEPVLERATCARCGTALARREGEWRHEVGFTARGGCREAQAEG